jgi:hypothetical protein
MAKKSFVKKIEISCKEETLHKGLFCCQIVMILIVLLKT